MSFKLPVNRKIIMKTPSALMRMILVLASIAMPGYFAVRHIASWPARVCYHGQLDNVESTVLAETLHLREGVPIYAPASPGRFDLAPYGPLFYLLGAHLVDSEKPTYSLLRVVSVIATVGMAAGCALLAFWIARKYLTAAIASLIFLAYALVTHFGTQARSDSMAMLLWFSGFLIAYRFQNDRRILFAIPLMTLGFYYKQQFVAGPLAVILFLLLQKRFRLAAEFTVVLSISGLSLLAVLQFVVFRHQDLLLHFLTYNIIPFSWQQAFSWGMVVAIIFMVPCAMAALFLRSHPHKLLACYLGWSVLLLPLLMAKRATNLNYALELLVVLCPLVAAQCTINLTRPAGAVISLGLLAITLWLGNVFPVWVPRALDTAQEDAMQAYLRANFPPRAPALGYYAGSLVRAGLDMPISDLYQYSWLACQGTVSNQILLNMLHERRFAVILLGFDLQVEYSKDNPGGLCLPPQFYTIVSQDYRPVTGSAARLFLTKHYYAWVPRK